MLQPGYINGWKDPAGDIGITDADYHVIAGTDAGEIMHHVVPGHVQGLGSGFGQFASPVYPVIHQPGTGSQANGAHVF